MKWAAEFSSILGFAFGLVCASAHANEACDAFANLAPKLARSSLAQDPHAPRVIVLAAPSGGGKTTLMERLIAELPDRYQQVIETTTRKPRGKEVNGKDYEFLSVVEFKRRRARSEYIGWARMAGNFYGTSRTNIDAVLAAGKSPILLTNPQNFGPVKEAYGDRAVTLYISPPDLKTLEARLRGRKTDSPEAIARRLAVAEREMKNPPLADVQLVNDDLDAAYGRFKQALGIAQGR